MYVYTWDYAQNDYSADPLITPAGGTAIDLGTYTGNYEWGTDSAGNAFETGSAQESYRPLMPRYEIGGVYDANADTDVPQVSAASSGRQGLANIPFAYATTASAGQITVQSITARPVTARFLLQAGFASTNATITVTINALDNINKCIEAVRNVKYVLIGQAGNATGTQASQNFVLATNYNAISGLTQDNVNNNVTPDYTTTQVTFTEASGEVNEVVAVGDPSSFEYGTPYSDTITFSMTDTQTVDCLLYMWIDGQNVRENASRGEFTFTLTMSGADANEGVGG